MFQLFAYLLILTIFIIFYWLFVYRMSILMADNPHKRRINSIGIRNEHIRTISKAQARPVQRQCVFRKNFETNQFDLNSWNKNLFYGVCLRFSRVKNGWNRRHCVEVTNKKKHQQPIRWNIFEDILFRYQFEYLFLVRASQFIHINENAIVINRFVNFGNMHAKRIRMYGDFVRTNGNFQ